MSAADAGSVSTARWYLNRLRCMSPGEIPHRLLRAARVRAEARGLLRQRVPAPIVERRGVLFTAHRPNVGRNACLRAADRILDGKIPLFADTACDAGNPPRWNRDPKTGRTAPLDFGKQLNYRDPQLVGDIKYLWELNRHQHLVPLAQAWQLSGDARYARCLRRHLESFFRDCPCPFGANWSSALEPAMRLVNWSLAWQILGGAESPVFGGASGRRFQRAWLDAVYEHARFIKGYYSLHSSANNHLVGEAVGVYVAARTWPHWPELERWGLRAEAILEREIRAQNAPDGVNREQAVSYQQFEFDLLLVAWLAGSAAGQPLSEGFSRRLELMLEFIASIMDAGGNVPMIGDSDDGIVARLDPDAEFCRYRSILATGAVLFRRRDFRAKARRFDDKSRWLLGDDAAERFAALEPVARPPRRAFPLGGYYVLGSAFESADEIRAIVDAGPLGYRGIAAHGHADALSFTLSVGGLPFLVDPGTYAYHADDGWRAYFRGTRAHNTLCIDGLDQSEPGGNFMWLKKAEAECTEWRRSPDKDVFAGRHDGYRRLADPVTHARRIVFDHRERRLTLTDRLTMAGEHDVALHFHLDEAVTVTPCDGGYRLERDGRRVVLRLPQTGGAESAVLRGATEPRLGWISYSYDRRRPTSTIAWRACIAGNTRLVTHLDC